MDQTYLHILLLLTFIGAWMNTNLFNPTRDKYYAMILMRMNAREYTLVNYMYTIIKVIIGFMPFSILFGLQKGIPLWLCLLIPFSVAGVKWQLQRLLYGIMKNEDWFTTKINCVNTYG